MIPVWLMFYDKVVSVKETAFFDGQCFIQQEAA